MLAPTHRPAAALSDRVLRLLNEDVDISDSSCWNNSTTEKLTLYHLHYHDILDAYARSGDVKQGEWFLRRWIDENPPAVGNGWEPYPISRRSVNWIKWSLLVKALDQRARESLYLQIRALNQQIEYHLLANHLFANAKALYLAGLFFDTRESEGWRRKGERLLHAQVAEQVLADGGHFERSPMYHATTLDDILDIVNICRVYGAHIPANMTSIAAEMLSWLESMTLTGSDVAHFNDSVAGIAPDYAEMQAYARRLDVPEHAALAGKHRYLRESGFFVFRGASAAMIIDVGGVAPGYQPGHAHSECLSFECSIDDKPIFVNAGISTYSAGERRIRERSTSSHNTVVFAGHEQSEIWSSFRVGRRAIARVVESTGKSVLAEHDGYARFGVMHRRGIEFDESTIRVSDRLIASAEAVGEAFFHLAPGIDPALSGSGAHFGRIEVRFHSGAEPVLEDYEYCRGFNDRVTAKRIRVPFAGELVTVIDYADSVH